VLFAGTVVATASAEPAEAVERSVTAVMACDRVVEPGRVKCTVEASVPANRTIAWADVVLVDLPDFATALKGRVGPGDVVLREPSTQRWAFGLVAKRTGEGEARANVRLLVCEAGDASAPRCLPALVEVRGRVRVGA
jgi:hypothetical protein